MKCPHCRTEFHDQIRSNQIGRDKDGLWSLHQATCPACERFVLSLVLNEVLQLGGTVVPGQEKIRYLVRPKSNVRPNPPKEVPEEFASDYREAAAVLSDSPKASAALSRRCLQHLIREKAGIKKPDLAKEIEELISSKTLAILLRILLRQRPAERYCLLNRERPNGRLMFLMVYSIFILCNQKS